MVDVKQQRRWLARDVGKFLTFATLSVACWGIALYAVQTYTNLDAAVGPILFGIATAVFLPGYALTARKRYDYYRDAKARQ